MGGGLRLMLVFDFGFLYGDVGGERWWIVVLMDMCV